MLKIHKEKSRIFDRKKKVLPFQKLLREKGELNMETEWRNYRKKNYEELELKDDFMFGKVMQNEELCRRTLETLLEMPIRGISSLERQKGIELLGDRKGIRLDIYVRDADKTVYDAEMQQRHKKEDEEGLPKRTRYYQGLIDLDILESIRSCRTVILFLSVHLIPLGKTEAGIHSEMYVLRIRISGFMTGR